MRTRQLVLFLAVLVMVARPAVVGAQLLFTLSPSVEIGAPGTEVIFSGTLTNTGQKPVFLNSLDPGFVGNSALFLSYDQNVFNSVTSPLAAGASFNGQIFGLNIDPATPPGIYSGVADIFGGGDSSAGNSLATADYSVSVSPAPGGLEMLAVAGVCGLLVRRIRVSRRT